MKTSTTPFSRPGSSYVINTQLLQPTKGTKVNTHQPYIAGSRLCGNVSLQLSAVCTARISMSGCGLSICSIDCKPMCLKITCNSLHKHARYCTHTHTHTHRCLPHWHMVTYYMRIKLKRLTLRPLSTCGEIELHTHSCECIDYLNCYACACMFWCHASECVEQLQIHASNTLITECDLGLLLLEQNV